MAATAKPSQAKPGAHLHGSGTQGFGQSSGFPDALAGSGNRNGATGLQTRRWHCRQHLNALCYNADPCPPSEISASPL